MLFNEWNYASEGSTSLDNPKSPALVPYLRLLSQRLLVLHLQASIDFGSEGNRLLLTVDLDPILKVTFPVLEDFSVNVFSLASTATAMSFWSRHPQLVSIRLLCPLSKDVGRSTIHPLFAQNYIPNSNDFLPSLRELTVGVAPRIVDILADDLGPFSSRRLGTMYIPYLPFFTASNTSQ